MLRLTGISHRYVEPGRTRGEGDDDSGWVLRHLDLHVGRGHIVGVLGPSGCGKSTLLRIAALHRSPTAGTVTIAGEVVTGAGPAVPAALRRRIALVPQTPRAAVNPRLRLRDIIAEPLSHASGRLRIDAAPHAARVAELAERFHLGAELLDRRPAQVSDGQLQRAVLARALALTPDLLCFDEPTAMLDAPTTAVVAQAATDEAARGAAVLIASHDAPLLDVLAGGRLVHL